MQEKKYNVVFDGQAMEGRDPEEVKKSVGEALGLGEGEVEFLFESAPMVIRTDLDKEEAMAVRLALFKAGALCTVKSEGPPGPGTARPEDGTARMITCPHCGTEQQTARECKFCGQRMKRPKA